MRSGGQRVFVVGAVALLFVVGVAWQAWSGKLGHAFSADSPLAARLQVWQVSHALIRDHPLLGTGLGTFEPAYQQKLHEFLRDSSFVIRHSSFPREWVVRDPHNVLLSFWLHFGLLGLLAMAGLVVRCLPLSFFRAVQEESYDKSYDLSYDSSGHRAAPGSAGNARGIDAVQAAAAGALLTLLLFGLVDVPYLKNDLALLWWALLVIHVARPGGSAGSGIKVGVLAGRRTAS